MTYLSRAVFVDTREKAKEYERLKPQFEELGVETIRNKLWIGDYQLIHNPLIVVDRKKDLLELIGNVTQQHDRFRKELQRAQDHNIQLVVLVEHGNGIESMEDLNYWYNPRLKKSPNATTGTRLKKILETMEMIYGVKFVFCDKSQTAKRIIEILEAGVNDG